MTDPTFTDHDIEKYRLIINTEDQQNKAWWFALLARLEAAEKCVRALDSHDDLSPIEVEWLKDWGKAAGRA